MLIVKRIVVWLLERVVEAFLLGGLLGYVTLPNATMPLSDIWFFGVVVATFLFIYGYYVTTAFAGVLWRPKSWLYSTITATLFIVHAHIIFVIGRPDFTPEARAMEFPFLLGGAGIVLACALAGSRALEHWVRTVAGPADAYLSASGLTLLAFALANVAHFLRPIVGDSAFSTYGVPFIFYREGGFVKQWVWRSGEIVWRGMFADAALIAAAIMIIGKVWQRVKVPESLNERETPIP
jgi:hypothetical protein